MEWQWFVLVGFDGASSRPCTRDRLIGGREGSCILAGQCRRQAIGPRSLLRQLVRVGIQDTHRHTAGCSESRPEAAFRWVQLRRDEQAPMTYTPSGREPRASWRLAQHLRCLGSPPFGWPRRSDSWFACALILAIGAIGTKDGSGIGNDRRVCITFQNGLASHSELLCLSVSYRLSVMASARSIPYVLAVAFPDEHNGVDTRNLRGAWYLLTAPPGKRCLMDDIGAPCLMWKGDPLTETQQTPGPLFLAPRDPAADVATPQRPH